MVKDSDEFKPLRYRNRWFRCLDLLGFAALVNDNNIGHVIPLHGLSHSLVSLAMILTSTVRQTVTGRTRNFNLTTSVRSSPDFYS